MPRQNTSPADYPQAVLQQIEQLANNIAVARKRRGETQAQWAKRLGVSQPTFARIERGDPGVAMASYVMCMWLINPAVNLADLVSPLNDRAALEREVSKVSKKGARGRAGSNTKSAVTNASALKKPQTDEGNETQPGEVAHVSRPAPVPSIDQSQSPEVANKAPALQHGIDPRDMLRREIERVSKMSALQHGVDPSGEFRKAIERASKMSALQHGVDPNDELRREIERVSKMSALQHGVDPSGEFRREIERVSKMSALQHGVDPSGEFRKAIERASKMSALQHGVDPNDELRKAMERAAGTGSSTAGGLAALLSKTQGKPK